MFYGLLSKRCFPSQNNMRSLLSDSAGQLVSFLSFFLNLQSYAIKEFYYIYFGHAPPCWFLVPHPGIKPRPPALEMQSQSLNHQPSPKEFYKNKNQFFSGTRHIPSIQQVRVATGYPRGQGRYRTFPLPEKGLNSAVFRDELSSLTLPPPWKISFY